MIRRIFLCFLVLAGFSYPALAASNAASWADEIIYFVMIDRFADGDLNNDMDALFDFSFRDRVLKLMSGVYDAAKFGRYLVKRHNVEPGYFLAPFLSNHDMAMMLSVLGGDKRALAIAATILMSIEGPPVIVYGEEIGRRGGVWPDNREVMAWGNRDIPPGAGLERDEDMRQLFVDLIALRKATPSLRGGEIEVAYSDRDVLVYRRGSDALIMVNRAEEGGRLQPDELPMGDWKMVFSSTDGDGGDVLSLPARSARIFLAQ